MSTAAPMSRPATWTPAPPRRAKAGADAFMVVLLAACLAMMFAFPKGGIKVLTVPITFSYLVTPVLILAALARIRSAALPVDRLVVLAVTMTMAAWTGAVLALNGTVSWSFTSSFVISVAYLPLFGMLCFSSLLMAGHEPAVERIFLWICRFVVIYGLFLFVFKMVTGRWIEVPYLTVNAADVGQLDDKFINRGGIFKLISTYNNGNIFGVSMCIVGPFYLRLENRRVLHAAFYLALLLTLARTCWIGIILIASLRALSRGIRFQTVASLAIAGAAGAIALYYVLLLLGRDVGFLFDRNLGGRAYQLAAFLDGTFLPHEPVKVLPEIVYAGIVASYGWFGLILFLAYLTAPILVIAAKTGFIGMTRAQACAQGLACYVVLAASDGAISYIPVMLLFWTVAGLGIWYARDRRPIAMAEARQ